jgi:hypothetical protein
MRFKLFDSLLGTKPEWDSGDQSVSVENGLFAYPLGSSVPLDPSDFTDNSTLYLEVQVDGTPIAPRIPLSASPYAIEAEKVEWSGIVNMPGDFADGIDNVGSGGGITKVVAGQGLGSGGDEDSVAIWIAVSGVTSSHIQNGEVTEWDLHNDAVTHTKIHDDAVRSEHIQAGAIANEHVSGSANIEASKIAGVATLAGNQTFTGENDFSNEITVGDGVLIADEDGVRIGSYGIISPYINVYVIDTIASTAPTHVFGVISNITYNGSNMNAFGTSSKAEGDDCDAVYGTYSSASGESNVLRGAQGETRSTVGTSTYGTGVWGEAVGGAVAYGVRGEAYDAEYTNLAGKFVGDVEVTGTVLKGGSASRIDHPYDPENQYLQHAHVESSDMMRIENGNVITDENGFATVSLPEWFDDINRDFRYQLTVIGDFAQAIIAEKINDNRFTIRTDKPGIEVSWQVTGIRADRWAQEHRIEVEQAKPEPFRGYYQHPEAYKLHESRGIESLIDSREEE